MKQFHNQDAAEMKSFQAESMSVKIANNILMKHNRKAADTDQSLKQTMADLIFKLNDLLFLKTVKLYCEYWKKLKAAMTKLF